MPYASNNGCNLYYETFGDPADPTLLLVNGLGSQCTSYKQEWCERFVAAGFHVIRFDNRDVGFSAHFADAPVDDKQAAYRLIDMADDAVAVLDAAGIERAHVMGVSMGGMIVQQLAISHRQRLLTMTSIMSNTGESAYGRATPEAFALLTSVGATDREALIERSVAGLRIWGSPEFADEQRWRVDAGVAFDRAFDPGGVMRQFLAINASGSRGEELPLVTTPTLVIHGDRDTLIDISGGERTAELVPGAKFVRIEGMGHDYPPQLWDLLVAEIAGFCLAGADVPATAD